MPKNPVANHPKHKRLDINRSPLGAVPGYGSSMITRAASPPFDRFGLLPGGIHECTIKEIEVELAWNDDHRRLS